MQDLFTPEINSQAAGLPAGKDWTKDNAKTQQYDSYKVQAVLNEIDGYDHSRATRIGTPAVFGMNFQAVSTAQKLPSSDGKTGGYLADGTSTGRVDAYSPRTGRWRRLPDLPAQVNHAMAASAFTASSR